MMSRTHYRPTFDDPLQCVDKVTPVERRPTHESTKARALATWAARSTSPSATSWEMTAVTTAWGTVECLIFESWVVKGRLASWGSRMNRVRSRCRRKERTHEDRRETKMQNVQTTREERDAVVCQAPLQQSIYEEPTLPRSAVVGSGTRANLIATLRRSCLTRRWHGHAKRRMSSSGDKSKRIVGRIRGCLLLMRKEGLL